MSIYCFFFPDYINIDSPSFYLCHFWAASMYFNKRSTKFRCKNNYNADCLSPYNFIDSFLMLECYA